MLKADAAGSGDGRKEHIDDIENARTRIGVLEARDVAMQKLAQHALEVPIAQECSKRGTNGQAPGNQTWELITRRGASRPAGTHDGRHGALR